MRIALLNDNFYPELSGISDSILTLGQELGLRGHTVRFFAPRYGEKDYAVVRADPKRELTLGPNVSIERFSAFPSSMAPTGQGRAVVPVGLRTLCIRSFHPDVIHTNLFFGIGIEGLIASRLLHIPFVGTNHTAIRAFMKYSPIQAPWFINGFMKYTAWFYNRCLFVSSPSRGGFEDLEPAGLHAPHEVVPNPLDTKTFSPVGPKEASSLKKLFGFSPLTIIHAGRLSQERNVDRIIEVFSLFLKRFPRATLALAGHGTDQERLEALARKLRVAKSVKFLGTLSHEMLAKAYRASDVFLTLSGADTQSLTMMQAMAVGLPVVASGSPAFAEYVNSHTGCLVAPGDHRAVLAALVALGKSARLRAQLGAGARKSTEQYSPERIAARWEQIYEDVRMRYNKIV